MKKSLCIFEARPPSDHLSETAKFLESKTSIFHQIAIEGVMLDDLGHGEWPVGVLCYSCNWGGVLSLVLDKNTLILLNGKHI